MWPRRFIFEVRLRMGILSGRVAPPRSIVIDEVCRLKPVAHQRAACRGAWRKKRFQPLYPFADSQSRMLMIRPSDR